MTEKSFWEWYNETEKVTGSLMTPASAAKMLGTTRQYIEKLVNAGRLTKYYYEDLPFIGMNEITKEIARRKERAQKESNPETLLQRAKIEQLESEIDKVRQEYTNEMIKNKETEETDNYIDYLEKVLAQEKLHPFSTEYKTKK